MLVVNFFGTPGSGKSTGAIYVAASLKMCGINAEYVSEFAKDKVYEESEEVFKNQAYIFGKQYFRMSRCQEKVDVILTDSPLPNSIFYNNDPLYGKEFDTFVMNVFNSYNNLNYFILRDKPYNPSGRFQTEEESDKMIPVLQRFLLNHKIAIMEEYKGNIASYNTITTVIINYLEGNDEEKEAFLKNDNNHI